jgi:hypothetical protein
MGLAGAIGAWEPELMKYAFKDILTRKMYGKSLKDLTKEQLEREQEEYLRDKLLKEAQMGEKIAQTEYYKKRTEELGKPKEDPLQKAREELLKAQTEYYKKRAQTTGMKKSDFEIEKHIETKLLDRALKIIDSEIASPEEKNKAQNLINRISKKYKIDIDESLQRDIGDNINFDVLKRDIPLGLRISPLDILH